MQGRDYNDLVPVEVYSLGAFRFVVLACAVILTVWALLVPHAITYIRNRNIGKIENIWKKKWLGYSLIAVGFTLFAWLNWHLPPSGYGVVAMAVVAGIMAIRPEIGGWERSLWFVVLVCFAIIEIRAINHDREQAKTDFGNVVAGLKQQLMKAKHQLPDFKQRSKKVGSILTRRWEE